MKILKWTFIFTVVFVLNSAAQVTKSTDVSLKSYKGGILYRIYNPSKKSKISQGDFLMLSGYQIDPEGKIIFSTYKAGRSAMIYCENSKNRGDLFSVLTLLSEGDSAIIKLNLDTLRKYSDIKSDIYSVSRNNYITYNLKVEKVISKGSLTKEEFDEKVQAFVDEENQKAKNSEAGDIERYIMKKKISPSKTPSGLYYIVHKQGEGSRAKVGDTVVVNYTGRYLSGAVFDTSIEMVAHTEAAFNKGRYYSPVVMPVGSGKFISGFDESLFLIPEGSIYTVIVPSKLAFDSKGDDNVPPYTPLIFEIELIEVMPKK